jgi:hypothetical protein
MVSHMQYILMHAKIGRQGTTEDVQRSIATLCPPWSFGNKTMTDMALRRGHCRWCSRLKAEVEAGSVEAPRSCPASSNLKSDHNASQILDILMNKISLIYRAKICNHSRS